MLQPLAFMLIATLALAAGALRPAATHAQSPVPSRERELFVSAVDQRGEPVETLAPSDVVVREDGVRREVLRVSRAIEPIDVAVLVDDSEAAESALQYLRESIRAFLTAMAGQNNVALIGLASRPTVLVDYTKDAKPLQDGIGRMFTRSDSGMTLLDGITEIANGLARREATRAVLVAVVTDGVDVSHRYSRDATDAMQRAGVALHAVTVGTFPLRTDSERERAIVLDQGVTQSGGQRIALVSPTGLTPALQKLARELSSQFKVVYGRPESLIPPEKTEISSARQGVVVRGRGPRSQTGA